MELRIVKNKTPLLDTNLQRVLTANLMMAAIGVFLAHATMPYVSPSIRAFTGIVGACVLLWSGVAIGGIFFLLYDRLRRERQQELLAQTDA